MPEKPKKKAAGLSTTPAARRAAARAQAARMQRGADVFGGDVDELVNRSFVGQGVSAVHSEEPAAQQSAPAAAVPAQPDAFAVGVVDAAPPQTPAVSSWLAPRLQPGSDTGSDTSRRAAGAPANSEADPAQHPGAQSEGREPRRNATVEARVAEEAPTPSEAVAHTASAEPAEKPVPPGETPEPNAQEGAEGAAAPSAVEPSLGPGVEARAHDSTVRRSAKKTDAATPPVVVSAPEAQAETGPDAAVQAPGRGRRSGSRRATAGVTRETVLKSWTESTMDLKLGKNLWQTLPFRFAPDLVISLGARVAQDREASGRQLTVAQYVDAAMRLFLPRDTHAQLALAEAFFIRREGDVPAGRQSSHRVSPEVYEIASRLPNDLRMVGRARTAVHVYSAALDLFLTALHDEGPLA